jgi:D-arginine dehydrogenase
MADHSSDIVIIGGGVAGQTVAAHLAPHAHVTVLETEPQLGYHASGRSAAMFLESYGNDIVCALNRASADALRAADVLKQKHFMLIAGADQDDLFTTERNGFGATEISVSDAANYLPILDITTTARAAYYDMAFDLDTDMLMHSFQKTARNHGATFVTNAPVTAITHAATGWTITTPTGTYGAPLVVNAAGAWADPVATLAGIAPLGIQPFRRSMARLPAPGGHDTTHWPFVDAIGESWYAKPDAGAWLVSPSEEHPMDPHDAWADDMVIAEGLDRYGAFMTEPVTRVLSTWAGFRSFAPDRALVLGPDCTQPSFYWCAGQGGYGFQTAPAAGALIAAQILGQSPDLDPTTIAAVSPDRF